MNVDAIESALKSLDRELWIVTAADGQRRGGLLATWVSSASIDRERPVMLAGIAPNHFTCELIEAGGGAGLHLIGREQIGLALNFAIGTGRERDKFVGIEYRSGEAGAPILKCCVAWFETRVFARLATGDRTFYWLEVLAAQRERIDPPARESDLFAAATPEQKRALIANRDADIAVQRPQHDAWRAALPPHLRYPEEHAR